MGWRPNSLCVDVVCVLEPSSTTRPRATFILNRNYKLRYKLWLECESLPGSAGPSASGAWPPTEIKMSGNFGPCHFDFDFSFLNLSTARQTWSKCNTSWQKILFKCTQATLCRNILINWSYDDIKYQLVQWSHPILHPSAILLMNTSTFTVNSFTASSLYASEQRIKDFGGWSAQPPYGKRWLSHSEKKEKLYIEGGNLLIDEIS